MKILHITAGYTPVIDGEGYTIDRMITSDTPEEIISGYMKLISPVKKDLHDRTIKTCWDVMQKYIIEYVSKLRDTENDEYIEIFLENNALGKTRKGPKTGEHPDDNQDIWVTFYKDKGNKKVINGTVIRFLIGERYSGSGNVFAMYIEKIIKQNGMSYIPYEKFQLFMLNLDFTSPKDNLSYLNGCLPTKPALYTDTDIESFCRQIGWRIDQRRFNVDGESVIISRIWTGSHILNTDLTIEDK